MKYSARAIHGSLGTGTVAGEIRFEGEKLIFESPKGRGQLPLTGLTLRRGGHNDEQIFFSHADYPDWSIYSSDLAVLEDPNIRMRRELSDQLLRTKRQRVAWTALVAGIVAFLIAGAMVVFGWVAFKDQLVHSVAKRIPVSWEVQFGETLFEQIRSQGKLVNDVPLQERLKTVTEPLLMAIMDVHYPIQFHVVSATNINAFAIPGGHVVVHTGLLNAVGNTEELAGVLAHEIAHVTQRHGFRKIIEASGLFLIVQALFGDATGLTAVLADSSRLLLEQKFSRDFEREADDVGWKYLLAARINPRGMIDFFEKLKKEQATHAATGLDFLSTHPATQERIDRLEEKWKTLEAKPDFIELPSLRLQPAE